MGVSKSDYLESLYLKLIFNATTDAVWASAAGSATNVYVSLHTADPLANEATGTQNTSETAYTGYARVTIARTSGGWTISGTSPTQVSPVANIDFGQCSASPGAAITHFAVGAATSGAGNVLYSGTVTPNITMAVGVIPRLTTASTITED